MDFLGMLPWTVKINARSHPTIGVVFLRSSSFMLLTTLRFPLWGVYSECGVCFLESFTTEVLYNQAGFFLNNLVYICTQ